MLAYRLFQVLGRSFHWISQFYKNLVSLYWWVLYLFISTPLFLPMLKVETRFNNCYHFLVDSNSFTFFSIQIIFRNILKLSFSSFSKKLIFHVMLRFKKCSDQNLNLTYKVKKRNVKRPQKWYFLFETSNYCLIISLFRSVLSWAFYVHCWMYIYVWISVL